MNELAEKALNVSREYFQSASSDSNRAGDIQEGDVVHDTLGVF